MNERMLVNEPDMRSNILEEGSWKYSAIYFVLRQKSRYA